MNNEIMNEIPVKIGIHEIPNMSFFPCQIPVDTCFTIYCWQILTHGEQHLPFTSLLGCTIVLLPWLCLTVDILAKHVASRIQIADLKLHKTWARATGLMVVA